MSLNINNLGSVPTLPPVAHHFPGFFDELFFERPKTQALDQAKKGDGDNFPVGPLLRLFVYFPSPDQFTPRLTVGLIDIENPDVRGYRIVDGTVREISLVREDAPSVPQSPGTP